MVRALLTPRRPGLGAQPPMLGAAWRGHWVDGAAAEDYFRLTGLEGHPVWPLLYPQMAAFRLQMAVLTHRSFPLPIWNALQIRNHFVLHGLFDRSAQLDFESRVGAQRIVEKGVEIDLRTTASAPEGLEWECTNTFYYRGRFGAPGEAAPATTAPRVDAPVAERWSLPEGGRLRCAHLTGDYNPLHLADGYARRFGFRGAFLHPQRVIGQCLARLPRPMAALPLQLEVWLKGPLAYGAAVELRVADARDTLAFALHLVGDARPAIVGRLRGTPHSGYTRRPEYSSAIRSSKKLPGLGAAMNRR